MNSDENTITILQSPIKIKRMDLLKSYNKSKCLTLLLYVLLCFVINLKFVLDIIYDVSVTYLNIIIFLLAFPLLLGKQKKEYILLFIILGVSCYSLGRSAVLLLMIAYAFRNLDYKQFALINTICLLLFLFVIYFSLQNNIINETIEYGITKLGEFRYRGDLGFGNSNRYSIYIYSILMSLYLWLPSKMNLLYLICITVISYQVYEYTDSKTYILAIICFVVCLFLSRTHFFYYIPIKYCFYILPLLFICLIYFICYSAFFYDWVNLILSNRLSYYRDLLDNISISNFIYGSRLMNEVLIDNSYLHLLFDVGILYFVIFYYLYYNALRYNYDRMVKISPVVISILLYGITESYFSYLTTTGSLLIWLIIYQNRKIKNVSY